MALSIGTRLGPYEITGTLGAGGMGEVYRARDTRLGREVALKILPEAVAGDVSRRQRFQLEARAVAVLNHPNIVAVYDVGEGYIVSELVEGEPLRATKLNLRKTIEIAVQVAAGLAAAHDSGIVHRDLKPDNILLTHDGRPKILDFGLAKLMAAHAAAADATLTVQTEAGMVMGTPGYMSPEQVRGAVVDHRTDIFSFGVILHELLSGKRAFQGETSVDAMQAILRQDPAELPETVPVAVRQIVGHCLEKEASKRFQSAHDLEFALASAGQTGSQPAIAAVHKPRSRTQLWALAALVLAAVSVAATILLMRQEAPSRWSGTLLGGPEMALNPRLAPDGQLVAFQAFDHGETQVAVIKPESGNWSILTHRRDAGMVTQVCWSPDGSVIYYDRSTDVPAGVYSVPVLGGEEHLVLENASMPEALPDGSLLVNRVNTRRQSQVYRFWPETGRLLELPLESQPTASSLSSGSRAVPGGKEAIAYASPLGRGGQGLGLYAIDLTSNAVRRVPLSERESAILMAWTVASDGKSVVVALPAGSIARVISIPIRGQASAKPLFMATNLIWNLEPAGDEGLFVNLVDRPQELVLHSADGSEPPARIAAFPVGSTPDQVLLLPDGRSVTAANASGHSRLMAAQAGKDPTPLINTQEETAAPMTLAGPREIALMIGPAPHHTIAVAEPSNGRIIRRIATGNGVIDSLTASPDGATLYFGAGGTVWAVPSAGGEAHAVSNGDAAVMEPDGRSLIVTRTESSHIRLFQVSLDGGPEREIPPDSASLLYTDHGGYFSSGSIDAHGRFLVALSVVDSWFNPIGILDTATGHVTRVPGDPQSDHHSAVWTPDGHIVSTEIGLRATLWKFQMEGK